MATPPAATFCRIIAAALCIFSSACIPAVNHGPQVEPGWHGGLTASYPMGPNYGGGDWGHWLYGPTGLNLSHGWRGTPDGGALLVSVHAPATMALLPAIFSDLAQADAYYQVPARISGGLDAGIGTSVARSHFMPYVQVGSISDNGSGWYTTQGMALVKDVTMEWNEDRVRSNRSTEIFWMPTIAYQMGNPTRTYHWFVTGALGRHQESYCFESCFETRHAVSAGVSVQFHRRR